MPAARDQDFLDFVLDQLSGLRGVTYRRMFGAIGLYQTDRFFAIIDEGRLYFLTGESSRERYRVRGMKPFEYAPGMTLRTYYEVPADVLEDDRELCEWAREAVAVQAAKSARRAARRSTRARPHGKQERRP